MMHHLQRFVYLFATVLLVSLASCQDDDASKTTTTKGYLSTGRSSGDDWTTAASESGYLEFNVSENGYHSRTDMPDVTYMEDSLVLYMHDPTTKTFLSMWNYAKPVQVNAPMAYDVIFGKVDSNVVDGVGNEWTRVEYINTQRENNFIVTYTTIGQKSGDISTGTFSGIVYPVTYQGDCNGCAVVDYTKKLHATGSFAYKIK